VSIFVGGGRGYGKVQYCIFKGAMARSSMRGGAAS
jgi:hypothetical protein